MADGSTLSARIECPVCREDYTDPKLLHCNHLVCRKCIVDWLQKKGRDGGCPLCRSAILLPSFSGHDDLQAEVDSLPTDLTMVGLVEGSKILNSRNVCMHCDTNNAASSFCLQCHMKLCKICAKGHKRIPTLKNHEIEELDQLTPERLAEINHSTCKSHDDRPVEMYCSAHEELICMRCVKTVHCACNDVKVIEEVAREKRDEFKQRAQRLRKTETVMKKKIKQMADKFKTMRKKAKDIFDDLQKSVEKRRQEVNDLIQAEEDKIALTELDNARATVMSTAGVIDSLVTSASDDGLLEMSNKMRSRLNDLEQRIKGVDRVNDETDVLFDYQKLTQLKSCLASLGQIGQQKPTVTSATPTTRKVRKSVVSSLREHMETQLEALTTEPNPTGAARVPLLEVGVRVKRGPNWSSSNDDGGGQGTVIAIPSKMRSDERCDPQGFVDVRWDNGCKGCYRMGRYGCYDLALV